MCDLEKRKKMFRFISSNQNLLILEKFRKSHNLASLSKHYLRVSSLGGLFYTSFFYKNQ